MDLKDRNCTFHRMKILIVFVLCLAGYGVLTVRLGYLMLFQG